MILFLVLIDKNYTF